MASQQGYEYEKNAAAYLKKYGFSDGEPAGASHTRPDIMLSVRGQNKGCELKISPTAGGSLVLKYYSKKTHPFQAQFQTNDKQIYLHAETDAINRALKYISKDELRKATLYVARVKYKDNRNKKAIWAESMPCIGCQKAITSYGIKNVVHTCNEGYKYM